MKLNTKMMWLWLFLVSGTLAVGQNTAPCPGGSRTGSVELAGQSSTSGRPAALAPANTIPSAATPLPATAAPTPGPATPVPATATVATGSAMPRAGVTTTQGQNSTPRPRAVSPQRSMPSAQTPNRPSGSASTTASLNGTPSPCTPLNNGAALPPVTGPPN